jgi:hypothetical protein
MNQARETAKRSLNAVVEPSGHPSAKLPCALTMDKQKASKALSDLKTWSFFFLLHLWQEATQLSWELSFVKAKGSK